MKKADLITIFIILGISITFYIYYSLNFLVADEAVVQILYKDEIVYESDWDEDLELTIALGTREVWTEAHRLEEGVDKVIYVDDDITNIIKISGKNIRMIKSDCRTKACLSMYIDRGLVKSIDCVDHNVKVRLYIEEYGGTITGGIIWWK
jgi:hypothetical protein